jgi:hypothetical protein
LALASLAELRAEALFLFHTISGTESSGIDAEQ